MPATPQTHKQAPWWDLCFRVHVLFYDMLCSVGTGWKHHQHLVTPSCSCGLWEVCLSLYQFWVLKGILYGNAHFNTVLFINSILHKITFLKCPLGHLISRKSTGYVVKTTLLSLLSKHTDPNPFVLVNGDTIFPTQIQDRNLGQSLDPAFLLMLVLFSALRSSPI